jgi:hypothetical protein
MIAITGCPVDAGFLCDKGAMPRDMIRETLCVLE